MTEEKEREIIESHVEQEEKAIVLKKEDAIDLDSDLFQKRLDEIKTFQKLVRSQLKKDHDFGVIPGTSKPTLLKPGAEKVAKLLGLTDHFEIISEIKDWENGFFHFQVKVYLKSIKTGQIISEGVGEANSKESKFAYRWVRANKLPGGLDKDSLPYRYIKTRGGSVKLYRINNDEIYSQVNTILKIAKKRAMVDAVLSAGRLSELFTQDLEDMVEDQIIDVEPIENEPEKERQSSGGLEDLTETQEDNEEFKSAKEKIDEAIKRAKLNRQEFLGFLDKVGKKKGKKYVGKIFNNYSLTEGNHQDVIQLAEKIEEAIQYYIEHKIRKDNKNEGKTESGEQDSPEVSTS
jgi:hypothetical protein